MEAWSMRTSHSTAFSPERANRPSIALSVLWPRIRNPYRSFSGYVAGLRLGSAPLLQFLYAMRAVPLLVGSTFRQARLPGAPDTAFGISATLLHAATLKP